jgi:hypothetical protein
VPLCDDFFTAEMMIIRISFFTDEYVVSICTLKYFNKMNIYSAALNDERRYVLMNESGSPAELLINV